MRKTLSILIMTAAMLVGCTKQTNQCEGKFCEEFTCLINGKTWKPNCKEGPLFGCSAIDCQYDKESLSISFRVIQDRENTRWSFSARKLDKGKSPLFYLGREFIDFSRGNCGGYDLDTTTDNYIKLLSLDTINFVVEGEFGLTAVSNHCPEDIDTITVTNGYFNVGYRF